MTNRPTRWLRATRAFLNELLTYKLRRGLYVLFGTWAAILLGDAALDADPGAAARRAAFMAVLYLAAGKAGPSSDRPR